LKRGPKRRISEGCEGKADTKATIEGPRWGPGRVAQTETRKKRGPGKRRGGKKPTLKMGIEHSKTGAGRPKETEKSPIKK